MHQNSWTLLLISAFALMLSSPSADAESSPPVEKGAQTSTKSAPGSDPSTNATNGAAITPELASQYAPNKPIQSYLTTSPEVTFRWIRAALDSIPGKPDQYTSPDERTNYERRVREIMQAVGPLAFISDCEQRYDAARQTLDVRIQLPDVPDQPNLRELKVLKGAAEAEKYQAQNAFGATTTVTRYTSADLSLAYPPGKANEPTSALVSGLIPGTLFRAAHRREDDRYQFEIPMPSNEARADAMNVACMYVLSLQHPYVIRSSQHYRATLGSPFEIYRSIFALFGQLDQVLVVNKATGKVYVRATRTP